MAKPSTVGAAPGGQTILAADACPFLQNLFASVASKAAGAAPPDDASGASKLVEKAFADYVIRLEAVRRPASKWGSADLLREVTTAVTVEVYRISDRVDTAWTPSTTLASEVVTPVESMSKDAAQEFGSQFPVYDATEARNAILAKLADTPRFASPPWDDSSRGLLASMLLLYRNVRLEQLLTRGATVGTPGTTAAATDKSLAGLIERGKKIQPMTGRVRQQVGDLCIREAQTVFDAFKSSQYILNEDILKGSKSLADELQASLGPLKALQTDLAGIQSGLDKIPDLLTIIAAQPPDQRTPDNAKPIAEIYLKSIDGIKTLRESYKSQLQQQASMLVRTQLFKWFMQDVLVTDKKVETILAEYPGRFQGRLEEALGLNKDQLSAADATPLQTLFASQDSVEMRQALSLYAPPGTPGATPSTNIDENALTQLIAKANPDFAAAKNYSKTLEPSDPVRQSLSERFPLYAKLAKDLAPLQDTVHKQIEAHAHDVDEPLKQVGEMAPKIIQAAIQVKRVQDLLANPTFVDGIRVPPDLRAAIEEKGKVDVITGLVDDVGVAFTTKIATFSPPSINPPPQWQEKLGRAFGLLSALVPGGPGNSGVPLPSPDANSSQEKQPSPTNGTEPTPSASP